LIVALVLATAGPAHAAECPQRLRIVFPDSPADPFMRGQGETFAPTPGLLVDWTRAALAQLGCGTRAELLRLPQRRIRAMLDQGQIDFVAGVGEAGPVAALLVLPPRDPRRSFDLSLGQIEYSLYALRTAAPRGNGQQLELAASDRVGVAQGTRGEALAAERGWPTDAAPSHESALQKLIAGRTRFLLDHSYFVDERLRSDPAAVAAIVKIDPPVDRRKLYVGAAAAVAAASPEFVDRFWVELCRQSRGKHSVAECRLSP
jgi:hypothetical protein